jgi:hypothetical protein
MLEYDFIFDGDPEEPLITSTEYSVIYISLFSEIEKQIYKKESQIKWCKEEDKYLKLHYQSQLEELMIWMDSIKTARDRAYRRS